MYSSYAAVLLLSLLAAAVPVPVPLLSLLCCLCCRAAAASSLLCCSCFALPLCFALPPAFSAAATCSAPRRPPAAPHLLPLAAPHLLDGRAARPPAVPCLLQAALHGPPPHRLPHRRPTACRAAPPHEHRLGSARTGSALGEASDFGEGGGLRCGGAEP